MAVTLAFSASSWAQDVGINGIGVDLEANKTPIHTAKNPQVIALLPKDLHLAVPGKFTVTVAALNSPPLTIFADDSKTLLGNETGITRLVTGSLGLEVNVVLAPWEDRPLGVISSKYNVATSDITVAKEHKEKLNSVTYHKDLLGFYVKSINPLDKIDKARDIAGLRIIVGSGTNQEVILLMWSAEDVREGLKPFTPAYTKDDAAQVLALQTGRVNTYFGLNVTSTWKATPTGKTKLVGSVDGGWSETVHIAVTLKKGSELVNAVQTALNGAIASGDCTKVLSRWGGGVESTPQSEVNPPGLDDRQGVR